MGGRAWGGKGWNFDVQIALSHATVTLCTTDLLLKPAQPLTIHIYTFLRAVRLLCHNKVAVLLAGTCVVWRDVRSC